MYLFMLGALWGWAARALHGSCVQITMSAPVMVHMSCCVKIRQQTTPGQEKDMQSAEVNSCAGLGVIDLVDSKFRWQVSTCVTGFLRVPNQMVLV